MTVLFLHITNGEYLPNVSKKLNLDGDVITWTKMLCEGKTLPTVGRGRNILESKSSNSFNKNYKVSKSWFIERP